MVKKLTISNKDKFFDQDLEIGEYFVYDYNFFLASCVEKIAKEKNVLVKYCRYGSFGYHSYGSFTFEFCGKIVEIEPQIFKFDVKHGLFI